MATYPEVIEKYNRRIDRFIEKMSTSKRILFVRTEGEGSFKEAQELELVLSDLVQHDLSRAEPNLIIQVQVPVLL